MADLTLIAGNPTARIHDHYENLMSIHCVDKLKAEATRVVTAGGISPKNTQKFLATIATKNSVTDLQFYLTNFMLSGAGLATTAGSRGARKG